MKPLGLISIFLILASVSLQSCGGKTDQYSGSEKPGASVQAPNVETELKRAKEKLSSLETDNQDLQASNKILSEKLKELQDAAENQANNTPTGTSPGGLSDQTRIALMGAKAVAEFKAQQAERRLESITADLTKKDDELKGALEQVEASSHENENLKNKLETLNTETVQKKSELEETVKKLEATIAERNSVIIKMEAESKEKEDLLNTLKKAWSDATQLKSAAEADLKKLKTSFADCQNQTTQLKTMEGQQKKENERLAGELQNLKKDYSSCMAQSQQLKAQSDAYLKQIQDFKSTGNQQPDQAGSRENKKPSSVIEKLLDGVVTDN
jgi:DNA repair exonuclease SbcCD ATPase subunit